MINHLEDAFCASKFALRVDVKVFVSDVYWWVDVGGSDTALAA